MIAPICVLGPEAVGDGVLSLHSTSCFYLRGFFDLVPNFTDLTMDSSFDLPCTYDRYLVRPLVHLWLIFHSTSRALMILTLLDVLCTYS